METLPSIFNQSDSINHLLNIFLEERYHLLFVLKDDHLVAIETHLLTHLLILLILLLR